MNLSIERGYLGSISPDGAWIAYGNAEVWLQDLPKLDVDERPIRIAEQSAFAGWRVKDGRTFAACSFFVTSASGAFERDLRFYDLQSGEWTPSGIPTSQIPGSYPQLCCVGSRIVSSVLNQHYLDGQPIETEPHAGHIEDFDGVSICFKVHAGDPWPLVVKEIPQ